MMSWTYFRSGKCEHCGVSNVERSKTFSADTIEAIRAEQRLWRLSPLLHKRCEPFYMGRSA